MADDFKFGESNKSAEFLKKFPIGKVRICAKNTQKFMLKMGVGGTKRKNNMPAMLSLPRHQCKMSSQANEK